MAQGKHFSDSVLNQIIHLLSSSELTISEIAARMACSRSAVASVNRRFQVRDYHGLRSSWKSETVSATPAEISDADVVGLA
jgi:hypothetical protein